MCGIVGFVGKDQAGDYLIEGLKTLEYRGYDSCGIATIARKQAELLADKGAKAQKCAHVDVVRTVGRIKNLEEKFSEPLDACVGIGHTRWATHGGVSLENCHPHTSFNGRFVLVHNGIIENYNLLKERFFKNRTFNSKTDTEIIPQLIELFVDDGCTTEEALIKTTNLLEGSYALCLIDAQNPDVLYVAKYKSPLLLGRADGCMYVGSDAVAMIRKTNDFIEILDGDVARVTKDGYELISYTTDTPERKEFISDLDHNDIDKGMFADYMLKEIFEQPAVIRNLLSHYFKDKKPNFSPDLTQALADSDRIYFIGCGTSFNAGLIGFDFIERWAQVPAEVHCASEFAYNTPLLSEKPFFIMISQSGETADVRAALTLLKERNPEYRCLVVTNAMQSSLARECDFALELYAGVEIAVASTKAYVAQLGVLSILAYALALQKGIRLSFDLEEELSKVALAIESVLTETSRIEDLSCEYFTQRNAFYIGRGMGFYLANEAALKLKEISYIQTEGFAGGELKHGTIALIEQNTPVIGLIANTRLEQSTRANISEVKARGAHALIITMEKLSRKDDFAVPNVYEELSGMVIIVVCQLLAYYTAKRLGLDIDKPRNLAKSVTVE